MRSFSASPLRLRADRRRSLRSQRGFSLLEAIVALVVFSGVGVSLYALLNTNMIQMHRAKDAAHQESAVYRAFDYLHAINPRMQPQGQADIGGGYLVKWDAELMEPARQSQGTQGGKGLYEVGLYEVDLDLMRTDESVERQVGRYRLRLVGYEKVRTLDY